MSSKHYTKSTNRIKRCRNGPRCPFLALGTCHFYHSKVYKASFPLYSQSINTLQITPPTSTPILPPNFKGPTLLPIDSTLLEDVMIGKGPAVKHSQVTDIKPIDTDKLRKHLHENANAPQSLFSSSEVPKLPSLDGLLNNS